MFLVLTAYPGPGMERIRHDRIERITTLTLDNVAEGVPIEEQQNIEPIEVTAVHLIGKSNAVLVQEPAPLVTMMISRATSGELGGPTVMDED